LAYLQAVLAYADRRGPPVFRRDFWRGANGARAATCGWVAVRTRSFPDQCVLAGRISIFLCGAILTLLDAAILVGVIC